MGEKLSDDALDCVFRQARTHKEWQGDPLSDLTIRELYDLVKLGPTSLNCCPARFAWVQSAEGKAELSRHALPGNQPKILAAPLTVIVGYDLAFAEQMPVLFPARAVTLMNMFKEPALASITALRNSSIQGGYLILAARALGLDCGPMSGFDHDAVDRAFFSGTTIKSNFLCNIGYGSGEGILPRNPRLSFEAATRFA